MSAVGEMPPPAGPPREPVPVDFRVHDGISEEDELTHRVSDRVPLRVSNVLLEMYPLLEQSTPTITKSAADLTESLKGKKGSARIPADIRCRVICFLAGTLCLLNNRWCDCVIVRDMSMLLFS